MELDLKVLIGLVLGGVSSLVFVGGYVFVRLSSHRMLRNVFQRIGLSLCADEVVVERDGQFGERINMADKIAIFTAPCMIQIRKRGGSIHLLDELDELAPSLFIERLTDLFAVAAVVGITITFSLGLLLADVAKKLFTHEPVMVVAFSCCIGVLIAFASMLLVIHWQFDKHKQRLLDSPDSLLVVNDHDDQLIALDKRGATAFSKDPTVMRLGKI